jgi:vitamin K-dependent gamma-carboxylase
MTRLRSLLRSLLGALLRPVDGAWLAAFRLLYGVVMAISILRLISYGWVERVFADSRFHFKYWGFEWVEPLSGAHMQTLAWVLAALALAVAAGFGTRWTMAVFALGLCYVQLLDASTYLNHYYLSVLLAWLLCFSPAIRVYSVDAWLRRRVRRPSAAAGAEVAAGWLYLLRFQVGVVYVFAGLAKFQTDWLIHAQPLRIWLGASTGVPILGPLLTIDWVPLAMSWAGFLFDTTIVGWLSFKKTRPYAYVVVIVFHLLTRVLFPIGMFPAIMTASALVFFSPSWPRVLLHRVCAALRLPVFQAQQAAAPSGAIPTPRFSHGVALALGAAYCLVQLAMPLRALAYGGNVLWHEQGMRFSWRVMVRAKGGDVTFLVVSRQTGKVWHVSPRSYLTRYQENEMEAQPDLILQLAHHVKQDFATRGFGDVEVRVDAQSSLNGRRGAAFIDPALDLASIRDGIGRASWILPAPAEAPPHTRPVL